MPADKGVCTDIVIRAYRKLGIDLQKEVHVDMLSNFKKYPQNWGLSQPDKNIDHRRVPNLMTFFRKAWDREGPTPRSKNLSARGHGLLELGRRHHTHWHCVKQKIAKGIANGI